ncbi:LexA family protein [Peptococcus simiae]|uniref:LexA family protein n=1 Tax=Peptococcus simiae TaxID=1643805 RepID=UPI00398100CF
MFIARLHLGCSYSILLKVCLDQIIYARKQPTVENGQIAVVQIQGPDDFQPQAYLKKVKITGTTAQLISLNKAYDTITVPLDELTVLGTVI